MARRRTCLIRTPRTCVLWGERERERRRGSERQRLRKRKEGHRARCCCGERVREREERGGEKRGTVRNALPLCWLSVPASRALSLSPFVCARVCACVRLGRALQHPVPSSRTIALTASASCLFHPRSLALSPFRPAPWLCLPDPQHRPYRASRDCLLARPAVCLRLSPSGLTAASPQPHRL